MNGASRDSSPLKWLTPLAVFALVWVVFGPALDAQFLFFDDDQAITDNRAFRGLDGAHLTWMLRASHLGHFQPLTWLSFAVDHALFGLDAGAFHRTNVLLHGLCALAFYAFARALLARALPGRPTVLAAGAAALLFAVHPLRAESVAWVTERRDVLSGLFLMLGLGAWLRWVPGGPGGPGADRTADGSRASPVLALVAGLASVALFFSSAVFERSDQLVLVGLGPVGLALAAGCLVLCAACAVRSPSTQSSSGARAWYWVALLCFLLSLLSKAWGIVTPAVLLVLDVWPLGRLRGSARRTSAALGSLLVEKLPFIALSVVFARLAAWAQATQVDTMKDFAEHTLIERVAQAAYGLAWYPWKTLVPTGLVAIYDLPDTLALSEARFLVPLVAVLILTVLLLLGRRRVPALLAAWVAFGIVVSPVLGFAQSGPQLVADRYSYLACTPFALLAGSALLILKPRALVACVLALAIGGYGFLGRRQVGLWHDSATLWEHVHAERPHSPLALTMLASEHQRRAAVEPDPARRRALLERARTLLEAGYARDGDPHFPSGLALVHLALAPLEPDAAGEHLAQATALAREALERSHETNSFAPHYRLIYGTALWSSGRQGEALGHFEWFVGVRPDHVGGLLSLGRAQATLGQPRLARAAFERALGLDPTQALGWRELAGVYDALGEPGRARQARQRAAALGG